MATNTPAPTALPTSFLAAYAFPTSIDPASRYLFYLHGKIVEDQGLPAVDPVYGEYEYGPILRALGDHGFRVISEQRSKDTDAVAYPRRVAGQIKRLLQAGVPAGNITVVGASKGGWLAAEVSNLFEEPLVNYVLLGGCTASMVDYWKGNRMLLHGNVLAIRDSVDSSGGSCEELFMLSAGKGLQRHQEIVLHVGIGHGILYQPLEEWVLPAVQWAGG